MLCLKTLHKLLEASLLLSQPKYRLWIINVLVSRKKIDFDVIQNALRNIQIFNSIFVTDVKSVSLIPKS